jgi:RNA-binding protein
MSPPVLDGRQRRHLRALAYHLKPIVQVGGQGFTPGVAEALDQALTRPELVKVRVGGDDDVSVADLAEELTRATGSALAQSIGKTLLFYRPHPDKPRIQLPSPSLRPTRETP